MRWTKEYLPWMNNISIDGDKAWFVSSRESVLMEINRQSGQFFPIYEFVDAHNSAYPYISMCIKYGDYIVCAPYWNNYFLLLNLKNGLSKKIYVEVDSMVFICDLILYEKYVYAVAAGLGEVLELDMESKCLSKRYPMIADQEKRIWDSVTVNNKIYCLYSLPDSMMARVYEFNMDTKEMGEHVLSGINGLVNVIGFDGECFWLGGCRESIYVWNKKREKMREINISCLNLGRYDFRRKGKNIIDYDLKKYRDPLFTKIVLTSNYVWFIPYIVDKIFYFNKIKNKFEIFNISEEEETRTSLYMREMKCKYIMEYVREDRYIGLYSFKQGTLIEIDANNLKYEIKTYQMTPAALEVMAKHYYVDGMFLEEGKRSLEYLLFILNAQTNYEQDVSSFLTAGEKIYRDTI